MIGSMATPPPEQRKLGRNRQWDHLFNEDIISMPDAWEYPWFPVNYLLIESLLKFHDFWGDQIKVMCSTSSGKKKHMNLQEVANELSQRLIKIFLKNPTSGKRPVYGISEKFQNDPHWRDLILFYEYFHGDIGAGIGASHQTGWTGLVAELIQKSAKK